MPASPKKASLALDYLKLKFAQRKTSSSKYDRVLVFTVVYRIGLFERFDVFFYCANRNRSIDLSLVLLRSEIVGWLDFFQFQLAKKPSKMALALANMILEFYQ